MKIILPAVLLLATASSFAKNYADQPFTPQAVQDILHCKASSLDFSRWISENFTGYLDLNERAEEENVGRFVNKIDNITYRYRLPFKVHLANPLDGKEVEGQYVAIRNNAIYLEIDWPQYPNLHSQYRQKYQENLQELTQQLMGQNIISKTTGGRADFQRREGAGNQSCRPRRRPHHHRQSQSSGHSRYLLQQRPGRSRTENV